jgi:diguanylate cyclase (GGDEF)-like protein/PAS domain S-box-containing protein
MARNCPVLLTALLGILITLASYKAYQWQHQQKITSHVRFDAGEYSRMLWQEAQSYVHLNRDVAGLFAASDIVTNHEFEIYIRRVQAFETHPGLSYIGYLPRIATNRIGLFEAQARKTIPSYSVHSNHRDADAVYPLLYAIPFDEKAKRFVGFDYAMISEWQEAMQKAVALGKPIATRKSAYLSTPTRKDYVAVFTPVYDADKQTNTAAQRRDALSGFLFSMFLIEDVVERGMGPKFKQQFDLEIYDGTHRHEDLIYDGGSQPQAIEDSAPLAAYTETIDFAGRQWILHFLPKATYTSQYASSDGWLILLSGSLASIILAWLTWRWLCHRRAQHQQAEHAEHFLAVFEQHPSAVFSLDTQCHILNANSQAIQQLEISRSKMVGASMLKLVPVEDAMRVQALLQEALSGVSVRYDSTLLTGNGKRIEVSIVLIPIATAGKVTNLLGIADNITERRQSEWKLQESQQMLRLVIDNLPQRVFWKDTELYYLGCNKAFCEDAGLDNPQRIVGMTDSDFPWGNEAEAYRRDDLRTIQSGIPKVHYEEPQHRQDGSLNWLRTSKIPLTDAQGRRVGVLGMYEDITERKQMEQRLEQMALYDSLTGLPNRAHFYTRLVQAVDRAERHGTLTALIYFDIDKFKQINDVYGHEVGDKVIAIFAGRVSGTIRKCDVVGRLGGDEFCLLIENLPNRHAAQKLAAKIIDSMQVVMQVDQIALRISSSMGIAFHEPGMTGDEVMRRADQAMYIAKRSGGNQVNVVQVDA